MFRRRLPTLLLAIPLALGGCLSLNPLLRLASDTFGAESCSAPPQDRVPDARSESWSLAWQRQHIRIPPSWGDTPLLALEGHVFFLGFMDNEGGFLERGSLFALAAEDGLPIPESPVPVWPGRPLSIAATGTCLYVGTDLGWIVALDPLSGDAIWRSVLGAQHRVIGLHIADEFLFAASPASLHILDSASGTVIPSDLPSWAIAWSPSTTTAISSPAKAIDTMTGDTIWEADIAAGDTVPPLITSSILFLRGGDHEGNVYAVDRNTGQVLFTSASPSISNIAQMGDAVLWLSSDGTLYSWEPGNLRESALVSFGSTPLDPECSNEGFFVAADSASSYVIIYLGDTEELLGFRTNS